MGGRRCWGSPVVSPTCKGMTAKEYILKFDAQQAAAAEAVHEAPSPEDSSVAEPQSKATSTGRRSCSPELLKSSTSLSFVPTAFASSASPRSKKTAKPAADRRAAFKSTTTAASGGGRHMRDARLAACIKELEAGPLHAGPATAAAGGSALPAGLSHQAQQAAAVWSSAAAEATRALQTVSRMQQAMDTLHSLREAVALLEQRKFSASMDRFAEMWAELQPLARQEREQAAAEAGAAAGSSAAHALLHRTASAIHDCVQQADQTPPPAQQALAPPAMLARSGLPLASPGKAGRYSWSNACHSNALYDMSPDTSLTSPPSSFRAPQHVAMRRLSMALAAQPVAEEGAVGEGKGEGSQRSAGGGGAAQKVQQVQQAQQPGIFLQLQDESFDWFCSTAVPLLCSTQGVSSAARCDHLLKALARAQDWARAQRPQSPRAAAACCLQPAQLASLSQLEVSIRDAVCELGVLRGRLAEGPGAQHRQRGVQQQGQQGQQAQAGQGHVAQQHEQRGLQGTRAAARPANGRQAFKF